LRLLERGVGMSSQICIVNRLEPHVLPR
jgi:hypothetical protein